MQHIETVTVGSGGAASITFMSVGDIPSEYTDLLIVLNARTNRANYNSDIYIQLNGVTTATYSFRRIYGDSGGGPGASDALTNNSQGGFVGNATGASATANTFGNCQFYIPNYRSSTAKSWSGDSVGENNATSSLQVLVAGIWSGTDPITSIAIKDYNAASFVQFSSASLYGITAGSDGIVAVS